MKFIYYYYITSSHPNPFRFISEDDWNKNIDELLNDIPKLSDLEITFRISQILSLLQDGHTVMDITSAVAAINTSIPEKVTEKLPIINTMTILYLLLVNTLVSEQRKLYIEEYLILEYF